MNMQDAMSSMLDQVYEAMDGQPLVEDYCARHGIGSMAILTTHTDEHAALVAEHLAERVRDKVVVEIGGGIGLLAFHLSQYAERVYVIEANPCWTHIYVMFLHTNKPKNVTFIFGAADELAGQIKGDVALFCTHSDSKGMRLASELFAPEVIDVYGEIVRNMDNGPEWNDLRTRKVAHQADLPPRDVLDLALEAGVKTNG